MAPTDRTGRNDPCPCGSGKKYKKCCLPKEKEARREAEIPGPGYGPVERALKWLEKRYPDEMTAAVHEHLRLAGEDALERLEELPEDLVRMVVVNVNEWLLADGGLVLDEGDVLVRELLLGPGGPLYDAEQRAWMEALTSRPLGLYEVLETTPGTGFRVRDLFHPDEPPIDVRERSASQTLVRWQVLGLRLVPWKGDWLVAGSVYPFRRDADFPEFLRLLREELAREAGGDPELERVFLSVVLPQEWLLQVLEPREIPEPVDAVTGEPILFVTDHYRVRSWERLEAALADRPDVEGDRTDGWTRFEEVDEARRRSLLALEPGRGERLQATARTRGRADEGREWLEGVAGDAIEHRTREIADPRSALDGPGGGPPGAAGAPGAGGRGRGDAPIPMTTELMQQVLESHYKDWAEDRIPALDGRTPREAVGTPEGREAVIGLLKLYEEAEARAARNEGREPASLQFLWDAVGLDRDEVLGG
jgi:hypothetical protein